MKLLNKTNLYFLGASMIVFFVGGIFFFFLFQVIIDQDLTNKLHERKNYVVKQIEKSDSLLLYQNFSANTLSIRLVQAAAGGKEIISDTLIYDGIVGRTVAYRQLAFVVSNKNINYGIRIRRALVEQRDLIKGVFFLESLLFLAFVAILVVLNNQLSKRLWQPFYAILDTINAYKLDKAESLTLGRNSISEFNELASSIEKMSAKISQEFTLQKEFIENTSHEVQTPLAMIRNELEVMLQAPGLTEKQINSINVASIAATRLSKINEALLILSRIENRQFHLVEDTIINDLVERQLVNFQELMQMKKIKVRTNFNHFLSTRMNPLLADMLMENLITNAIKHNMPEGVIEVVVDRSALIMSNTGPEPKTDPEKFFARFVKSNQRSSSLGLGLSIVKAICDTYAIPITYNYENKVHKISLKFSTLESLQN